MLLIQYKLIEKVDCKDWLKKLDRSDNGLLRRDQPQDKLWYEICTIGLDLSRIDHMTNHIIIIFHDITISFFSDMSFDKYIDV